MQHIYTIVNNFRTHYTVPVQNPGAAGVQRSTLASAAASHRNNTPSTWRYRTVLHQLAGSCCGKATAVDWTSTRKPLHHVRRRQERVWAAHGLASSHVVMHRWVRPLVRAAGIVHYQPQFSSRAMSLSLSLLVSLYSVCIILLTALISLNLHGDLPRKCCTHIGCPLSGWSSCLSAIDWRYRLCRCCAWQDCVLFMLLFRCIISFDFQSFYVFRIVSLRKWLTDVAVSTTMPSVICAKLLALHHRRPPVHESIFNMLSCARNLWFESLRFDLPRPRSLLHWKPNATRIIIAVMPS